MNDMNDAPFVDKPKRDPRKWKKNNKSDGFSNKAKKHRKQREQELYEDSLDEDMKEYR